MRRAQHIAIRTKPRDSGIAEVVKAYAFDNKTLYNGASYVLRNVFTSYVCKTIHVVNDKGKLVPEGKFYLKPDLHADQMAMLTALDAAFAARNAERLTSTDKRFKKTLFEPLLSGGDPFQVFEVLDYFLRECHDWPEYNPYPLLPGQMAQATIEGCASSFRSYFNAISAYTVNPSKFTGRPRLPKYVKTRRVVFKSQNLKGKKVDELTLGASWEAFAALHVLSDEAKAAWMDFKPNAEAKKLAAKLGHTDIELAEIEFRVSCGKVRATYVFKTTYEVDDESPLGRYFAQVDDRAARAKAAREKGVKLTAEEKKIDLSQFYVEGRVAGLDPGDTNIASIAFSDGGKNMVIRSNSIRKKIERLDRRIDTLKSNLTVGNKRLQALAAIAQRNRAERVEMAQLYDAIYQNEDYLLLREKRDNALNDAMHRIAKGIVDELRSRGMQVLVAGRSKRRKENCADDSSRTRNRDAHLFPTHKFYLILRTKCEMAGILFLETEESYTSQAYFALNEPFKKVSVKKRAATRGALGKMAKVLMTCASAPKKWRRIHADINAAFNMIRKVFGQFRWTKELRARYDFYDFEDWRGLRKS